MKRISKIALIVIVVFLYSLMFAYAIDTYLIPQIYDNITLDMITCPDCHSEPYSIEGTLLSMIVIIPILLIITILRRLIPDKETDQVEQQKE